MLLPRGGTKHRTGHGGKNWTSCKCSNQLLDGSTGSSPDILKVNWRFLQSSINAWIRLLSMQLHLPHFSRLLVQPACRAATFNQVIWIINLQRCYKHKNSSKKFPRQRNSAMFNNNYLWAAKGAILDSEHRQNYWTGKLQPGTTVHFWWEIVQFLTIIKNNK